jgi:hypothetical protein
VWKEQVKELNKQNNIWKLQSTCKASSKW